MVRHKSHSHNPSTQEVEAKHGGSTGEMSQLLKALTALPGDPSSVSSTFIRQLIVDRHVTLDPGGFDAAGSLALHIHKHITMYTHKCNKHTHSVKKKKKKSFF